MLGNYGYIIPSPNPTNVRFTRYGNSDDYNYNSLNYNSLLTYPAACFGVNLRCAERNRTGGGLLYPVVILRGDYRNAPNVIPDGLRIYEPSNNGNIERRGGLVFWVHK
jgi:hypothetical protein